MNSNTTKPTRAELIEKVAEILLSHMYPEAWYEDGDLEQYIPDELALAPGLRPNTRPGGPIAPRLRRGRTMLLNGAVNALLESGRCEQQDVDGQQQIRPVAASGGALQQQTVLGGAPAEEGQQPTSTADPISAVAQDGIDSGSRSTARLVDPAGVPVHPAVELLPHKTEREYLQLRADIRANGQRVPAVIHKGVLLDGRDRARICTELGRSLAVTEWDGPGSAVHFAVRAHLQHQNLPSNQRALIAVELFPHFAAEAAQHFEGEAEEGTEDILADRARHMAAQAVGLDRRDVDAVIKVLCQGTEKLQQAMVQNRLVVADAAFLAGLSAEEQMRVLELSPRAQTRKLRALRLKQEMVDFVATVATPLDGHLQQEEKALREQSTRATPGSQDSPLLADPSNANDHAGETPSMDAQAEVACHNGTSGVPGPRDQDHAGSAPGAGSAATSRLVAADLPCHAAANLLPPMSDQEYQQFKADIAANGQREPAVVFQGVLIDGRHRQRACQELGLPLLVRDWDGDGSPVDLVLALNLHRRQLNSSQLALLGASLLQLYEADAAERKRAGKALDLGANLPAGRSRDLAARVVGVSGRSIDTAAKVIRKGTPELIRAVQESRLRVSAAALLADLRPREQARILAGGPKGVAAKIRDLRRQKAAVRATQTKGDAAPSTGVPFPGPHAGQPAPAPSGVSQATDQARLEIDRSSDDCSIGQLLIAWLGEERACRVRDALVTNLGA